MVVDVTVEVEAAASEDTSLAVEGAITEGSEVAQTANGWA